MWLRSAAPCSSTQILAAIHEVAAAAEQRAWLPAPMGVHTPRQAKGTHTPQICAQGRYGPNLVLKQLKISSSPRLEGVKKGWQSPMTKHFTFVSMCSEWVQVFRQLII